MISEFSTLPELMLATDWDNELDLSGWWMSEKLDGVRAYWDGQQFWSRNGNPFHAPEWFTRELPDMPLDGELWGGRGTFAKTMGIVRRKAGGEAWRAVQYCVFDAPSEGGPFEERILALWEELPRERMPHASVVAQSECRSTAELLSNLATVESLGGEGLMLRRPGSLYEIGTAAAMVRVKSRQDAEGRVVEHRPGAGKLAGRTGSLLVELASGLQFPVAHLLYNAPPPIGETITFQHRGFTERGVPRHATFLRVATNRDL